MDAATDPSPPAAPEPAPTTFSNDYWGNINTIYQPAQSHDPPFGIGWDHPVFHHDPHQQPASHSAELYATPQPGWHQHSQLQHSAVPEPQQNYELQNQYRLTSYSTQQQPQQQANATPFEQPPSNSPYPPYGFDTQNYYQNPLTSHSSFEQQAPVELQRVALQNVTENSLEGHAPVYASPNLQNIQVKPVSVAVISSDLMADNRFSRDLFRLPMTLRHTHLPPVITTP